MTNRREFFRSGCMLAAVALLMRAATLGFNAYITEKVGAEGMGLLSLTMSVYAFAVTFATSGIALAVTRLVAAALGRSEGARAGRVLRAAVGYALVFGGTAAIALYLGSDFIALRLLSDVRTRSSLRLLSVSLVPIALSAVYSGYFVAVRRVSHNAVTQVFEQTVRIFLTLLGLSLVAQGEVEAACLALVGGSSVAELLSFFFLFVQARWDLCRHRLSGGETGAEARAVIGYALPCAVSAHARSGLVTVEHLLIPVALGWGGLSREGALASYAALHSMALPVLLFPTAVLASFSGLLVPECAELEGRGDTARLCRLARRALGAALFFATLAASLLFVGADDFGMLLYRSEEAGRYIRLLAPLVPVMYMDSVVDAHLKGLGYQVYSMGVNIADAAISVVAVLLFLPVMGADGYVLVIYLTEIFNFVLSLSKLLRVLSVRIPFKRCLSPLLCGACASLIPSLLVGASGNGALALRLLLALSVYVAVFFFLSRRPMRKTRSRPQAVLPALHIGKNSNIY